jgi:hypothetical protein
MLTAAQMIGDLDAAIAEGGQYVTLERMQSNDATGALSVTQQITCPAHIRAAVPQDLIAGEVQPIRVIVSATALAQASDADLTPFGMPSRDDRIVIDDNPSSIEQVNPLYYGGKLVRVNLICRG